MEERYHTRPELIRMARKKMEEEGKLPKVIPLWLGIILIVGIPTAIAFLGVALINDWFCVTPIGIKILGGFMVVIPIFFMVKTIKRK